MNEISFSYEKMGTKTRFEEEAKGNSEMAYFSRLVASSTVAVDAVSYILHAFCPGSRGYPPIT